MRSKIILILISFFLSIIHCNKGPVSECEFEKIRLLLEELFSKRYLFPAITNSFPFDSSTSYNYLYSTNLNIPEGEFYLHWESQLEPSIPDSVKLRILKDNFVKEKFANQVSMTLDETNEDSSLIKISIGYSTPQNRAKSEATFTYSFDEMNCRWTVLDSTFWQY